MILSDWLKTRLQLLLLMLLVAMIFFITSIYVLKIIVIEFNTNAIINKLAAEQKDKLASLLMVHTAYKNGEPLELYRHGRDNDGGYVVPKVALESADALIGYGIADDASFEDQFSQIYDKPSYGYDCSIESVESSSHLFKLVSECIASKDYLYSNNLSFNQMKVSSFADHIRDNNLIGKKIFVKMDIEGAEYDAFDDILLNRNNITGIVLEIHFSDKNIERTVNLLSKLNRNFLLLHVHGNNCARKSFEASNVIGKLPYVIELTYINKFLIGGYEISKDQSHPNRLDMPNCKNHDLIKFEIMM